MAVARRAEARSSVLTVNAPSPRPAPQASDPAAAITSVGVPAIEIARAADSRGADLIVLGRDVHAAMDRRDCRGVVEGTVRRARVPCLLVPHGHCAFRRVLAAVDGGPDSGDVVTAALLLSRLFEASFRVIRVEAAVPVGATTREPYSDVGGDTIVCHGDRVAEILHVAGDELVDLLVFGHHRGGPVSVHATNGVAPRLLQRARCAVLTVPI